MKKSDAKINLKSKMIELENLVADFMLYWGFKRIHGRIWIHLYTSTKPLDTLELMKKLKVSKGLMSLAIRELMKYNVIMTKDIGRHGTVYFEANPHLLKVITDVLRKREAIMMKDTKSCLKQILTLDKEEFESQNIDLKRLKNVYELTESAESTLQLLLLQTAHTENQTSITL